MSEIWKGRLSLAAVFAAVAYFSYPGDQIMDKGLATLTLSEVSLLIGAALSALAVYLVLTGQFEDAE